MRGSLVGYFILVFNMRRLQRMVKTGIIFTYTKKYVSYSFSKFDSFIKDL